MSRAVTGETIQIRPTNNIYTAITVAAVVVQIVGLVILWIKAANVGGLI
jgi:hypothetical protein